MTVTSALVPRAIIPIKTDFPTPEPENIPIRCPLPQVQSVSIAFIPVNNGSVIRLRSRLCGGRA